MSGYRGSIVIPAHNEASVIERCLSVLADVVAERKLDVVVSCNGCTDETAQVARSFDWVRVLETERASKTHALNLADEAVSTFPRLYIDADVEVPGEAAAAVLARLAAGPALAARPPYVNSADGASAVVRSYFRARSLMTSVQGSLWGAGVYGLSATGRARFHAWPDVVADDLFVNGLFMPEEIEIVRTQPVLVHAPRDMTNLVRVLRRAQRGKADLGAQTGAGGNTATGTARDLFATGLTGPQATVDAAVYAALAILARGGARLPTAPRWERDVSTRLG